MNHATRHFAPGRIARALPVALVATVFAVAPLPAAEVTLRMKGGGLEVKGELNSFDGQKYVIEAPQLGLMTFDAARIECIGDACARRVAPPPMPYEPLNAGAPETVAVAAGGIAAEILLPTLLRGYAAAIGASVTPILGTAAGETRFRLIDGKGAELANVVIANTARPLDLLKGGAAQIAMTEQPVGEADAKALIAELPEPRPAPMVQSLAGDGLALIVSPENPALALSEDAIARIFAGKVASWIDVGVRGAKIKVYGTEKSGSALTALAATLLAPRGLSPGVTVTELASESEVADAVTRDPNGIAIVSFAQSRNARRLNIEGACGIISKPTPFAVKAGEWALARRITAVTLGGTRSTAARDLLRFAVSKDAQALIAESQLVDTSLESQALEDQTGRMAAAVNAPPQAFDMGQMRELMTDVKTAKRLSLTFRFVPGTTDLDANARRDVARLSELMLAPENAGQTALLIGFTDAEGKLTQTVTSSSKRAGQVRSAVLAAAGKLANPSAIVAKGHGALAPIVCNDTNEHRQLNRRVEAWLRPTR